MVFARLFLTLLVAASFSFGVTTDEGNGLDPHGSPRTSARCGDDGNGLDPHGRPCPTPIANAGPGIDPIGGR
jgi:hypothetical protein